MTRPLDPSLLPPLAAELVEALGLDAALALVREFGGQTVYVPAQPPAGHPLTVCLGEAAAELGARFGREFLPVPKCQALLLARRNAEIVAACQERPVNAVAAQFRLTRRQIFNILAAAGDDPAPADDLFSGLSDRG
jgi:Mor family transcriptional regulator